MVLIHGLDKRNTIRDREEKDQKRELNRKYEDLKKY